jgi:glutamate 5-kinase
VRPEEGVQRSEPYKRIVVKVGTSTLTDFSGGIDRAFIADLTAQLAAQCSAGCEVILVTSGAIRAGRERLEARKNQAGVSNSSSDSRLSTLPYKQAAAAVGQGLLIHTYTEAFSWRNVAVAQVLLTRDDLADRRRFLNARNTLKALLALRVVPIINENDTVAVDEIKFGDNDQLAAHVAVLVEADLLLILSDVEGLYDTRAQSTENGYPLIRHVSKIDSEIESLAGGSGTSVGTGGMRTKIEAARIATASGVRVVIARGRREQVIADVVSSEPVGTIFAPAKGRLKGRKRWIAAGIRPAGSVTINARAVDKLKSECVSLLAVGIVDVCGEFGNGDLIEVHDEAGRRFARGLTNYGSEDLREIKGLRSDQIEAALGGKAYDEVIHRDNLVVDGS